MPASLPHPNIEPPPGAQLDSAALGAIFAEIQRNLDALSGKFPVARGDLLGTLLRAMTGGTGKVAVGFTTATFGGASVAASQVITPGFEPLFAHISPEDAGYVSGTSTYSPTTFTAVVQKRDGTSPANGTKAAFHWIAIG